MNNINNIINRVRYNATIINTNKDNSAIIAEHDTTRNGSIVEKANDYYLAITRFNLSAVDIPLTIIYIDESITPNITTTYFTFSLKKGTNIYTKTMEYAPEVIGGLLPTKYDPQNYYFWVYSYQYLCDLYNVALADLTALFNTGESETFDPPYFVYNTTLQKFQLYVPEAFYNDNVDIYINKISTAFFESFSGIYDISEDLLYFKWNKIQDGTNSVSINNETYYILSEEFGNFSTINSCRSIVFTTQSLPIVSEMVQSNEGVGSQSNKGTRKILTDFIPLLETAGSSRSYLNFTQNGPYRLIDLVGNEPIYRMDFQIFWVDKENIYHKLLLRSGDPVDVKFEFIRKETFRG
jgi:hypothetical protein